MNTSLSSQKLKVGDKFPAMSLTTTKGKELSIPVSGAKFTHVQFRRFSGCPICDTHIAVDRSAFQLNFWSPRTDAQSPPNMVCTPTINGL
jgi:hypothetical protein